MDCNKAVVIGHDKKSPGAYSKFLGQSEYIYNSEVASNLSHVANVYKRPLGGGYTTQMSTLASEINPKGYDYVVSLHFNKFDNLNNNKGVGCEVLIFPGNKRMRKLGEIYCKYISEKYGVPNRGVKEHGKGMRGYGFLSKMSADAIIAEPFFGDEDEALKFEDTAEYARDLEEIFRQFECEAKY